MSTWNVTLLALHAIFCGFAVLLFKAAPCWQQRLAVAGFAVGMGVMALGFGFLIIDVWVGWHLIGLGLAFEHLAVFIYLFRLIYQKYLKWTPSSTRYRSS